MLSESEIQNQILDWLNRNKIFAFRVNTTGVFDPKKNIYRSLGKFSLRGVSDIIAVKDGKIICIEVKSKIGKPSDEQRAFINKIISCGGIAFIARNIDDVKKALQLHFNIIEKSNQGE